MVVDRDMTRMTRRAPVFLIFMAEVLSGKADLSANGTYLQIQLMQ